MTQIKKILNNLMNETDERTPSGLVQTLITDHKNFDEYLDEQRMEKQQENNNFMQAYRLTGMSKVDGITDFMETLIENNCKFIVFAHH